jgi:hypothetical protein
MIRYLLVLVFFSLVGCSTDSIEITTANNHFKTPYYSITVPPNSGWVQGDDEGKPDLLVISKTVSNHFYIMRLHTNWLTDESMKSWTTKRLADNYRRGELGNMIRKGVNTGKFELKDVVMEEEKVDNKKFYTMHYILISGEKTINSFLYLHFPKEKNFNRVFVATYQEELDTPKSFKNEFLVTLSSLEMEE